MSAGIIGHPDVAEVPVTIDRFGATKGSAGRARRSESESAALAGHRDGDDPVGIMRHHAVTDGADLAAVDALLSALARHRPVRPTSIIEASRSRSPHGV